MKIFYEAMDQDQLEIIAKKRGYDGPDLTREVLIEFVKRARAAKTASTPKSSPRSASVADRREKCNDACREVLRETDSPLTVSQIHRAAEKSSGETIRWQDVQLFVKEHGEVQAGPGRTKYKGLKGELQPWEGVQLELPLGT